MHIKLRHNQYGVVNQSKSEREMSINFCPARPSKQSKDIKQSDNRIHTQDETKSDKPPA